MQVSRGASCYGSGAKVEGLGVLGYLVPEDLLSSLEDAFPPISASRVGSPDFEGSCTQPWFVPADDLT